MTLINDIRKDRDDGTPGPWAAANMVHEEGRPMTPDELGEYVANSVRLGQEGRFLFVSGKHEDGKDRDICHIGNGPKGPRNARRIARVPQLEDIALAAEELFQAAEELMENIRGPHGEFAPATRLDCALSAYKKARGEG